MVQFFRTWRGGIAGTMISKGNYNPEYLLDSDEEPRRLERQARIYGLEDDLRHLALRVTDMSRRMFPDYSPFIRPAHGLNRC